LHLTPGTRLGVYKVTALIGEGGMGQVYRATDTQLKRQVAIKALPSSLATDRDRLARFQREAEVLASLNHPHIAAIYGLEESGGVSALVMELVEGEDLAQRIARGAIPLDEALPIARQIADALEAAHEQGIIHRDLKPANIKVRPDGAVKVLDFGLAKAMEPALGSSSSISMSPTITTPAMTQAGMILGTAAYMSPEQARGKTVDKRADIWAFGCVLYEMLTGCPAFPGSDASEVLAGVIKSEPAWNLLPASPPVRALVQRCLQKDQKQRLRDVGDARIAIDEMLSSPVAATSTRVSHVGRTGWIVAAVLLISTLVVAWVAFQPVAPPPIQKLSMLPPREARISTLALSPDGQHLAFRATSAGKTMLWIRAMDSATASPLPGTDDATRPFWSPDSRSVGFFAHGKLNRIAVSGGPVQAIAEAEVAYGATWNREGFILFAPGQFDTIYGVSALGGSPSKITSFDRSKNESGHWHPRFLPDGRHFLYGAVGDTSTGWIKVGAIDGPETTALVEADRDGANAEFVKIAGRDYVLFARQRTLLAQRFDLDTLKVSGEAIPVTEEMLTEEPGAGRAAVFSISQAGVIAYRPSAGGGQNQLLWVDRAGKPVGRAGAPALYRHVELAPDGKRVAVDRADPPSRKLDIWLIDVATGTPTRFTFDPDQYDVPRWSPDGSRLAFPRVGNRKGLYQKLSNGAGAEEQLMPSPHDGLVVTDDWSSNGRFIVYYDAPPGISSRLWFFPLSGDRRAVAVPNTDARGANGRFSPDGRWLAYESWESGQPEVWIQPFPVSGGKWQISHEGGLKPRWRRDGKELYFMARDGALMAAPITAQESIQAGAPVRLFPIRTSGLLIAQYPYDVSADGQRFLVITPLEDEGMTPVTILLNWRPRR